jgi:hypothetical protein
MLGIPKRKSNLTEGVFIASLVNTRFIVLMYDIVMLATRVGLYLVLRRPTEHIQQVNELLKKEAPTPL